MSFAVCSVKMFPMPFLAFPGAIWYLFASGANLEFGLPTPALMTTVCIPTEPALSCQHTACYIYREWQLFLSVILPSDVRDSFVLDDSKQSTKKTVRAIEFNQQWRSPPLDIPRQNRLSFRGALIDVNQHSVFVLAVSLKKSHTISTHRISAAFWASHWSWAYQAFLTRFWIFECGLESVDLLCVGIGRRFHSMARRFPLEICRSSIVDDIEIKSGTGIMFIYKRAVFTLKHHGYWALCWVTELRGHIKRTIDCCFDGMNIGYFVQNRRPGVMDEWQITVSRATQVRLSSHAKRFLLIILLVAHEKDIIADPHYRLRTHHCILEFLLRLLWWP